jgi:hypothetical protein
MELVFLERTQGRSAVLVTAPVATQCLQDTRSEALRNAERCSISGLQSVR